MQVGGMLRSFYAIQPAKYLWCSIPYASFTSIPNRFARLKATRHSLQDRIAPSYNTLKSTRTSLTTRTPVCAASAAEDTAATSNNGLSLYNTLTRQKEPFTPRSDQGNKVSMYVCGVTVYDYSHIGHARVYVAFDVLYRFLQHLGYDVNYTRNFTDVDDKIINRANETGEDPLDLSKRFITEFHVDMDLLGCLRPTVEPLATEYIPAMVEIIEKIIENGHAYAVGGDVFFDVDSLPGYGKLSGRSQDDNRAGERVAVDDRKRGAADFALWKAAKPGEPTWESPWGAGRPGWHIECSAMIHKIMGSVIDIHGGGRDLIFPHHENELAQSRAAFSNDGCGCGHDHHHEHSSEDGSAKEEFVRYWVHNGFVNVDAEKMSKSLGNFFTIRDVLEMYHPIALRWFLVNTQYRQPINYTQRALEEASDRLYYLYQTILDAQEALAGTPESVKTAAESPVAIEIISQVVAALGDDLNTPNAIAALSAPLKEMNDLLHTKKGKKQADRLPKLAAHLSALEQSLTLLGMWAPSSQDLLQQLRDLALVRAGVDEGFIAQAIEERAAARAAKDYEAADNVRGRLDRLGIMIMDTPQGTTWRPGLKVVEEEEEVPAAPVAS